MRSGNFQSLKLSTNNRYKYLVSVLVAIEAAFASPEVSVASPQSSSDGAASGAAGSVLQHVLLAKFVVLDVLVYAGHEQCLSLSIFR